MTRRDIFLVLALLALFWIAALGGLPEMLGAHPWWAVRAGVVGSLIGAATAVGLGLAGLAGTWLTWASGSSLVAALGAAIFGKRAFVASMAEDALAGRFWFFGWYTVCACLFVFAFLLLRGRIGR